jgi:hypothetical protein
MDGVPILDYTPEGLLGLVVVLILFGVLVPYRVVKQLLEEIAHLRSALGKSQDALIEEQKTGQVVRRFFEGLEDR